MTEPKINHHKAKALEEDVWNMLIIEFVDCVTIIAVQKALLHGKETPKHTQQLKAARAHAIMCLQKLTAPFDYDFDVELQKVTKSE